MNRRVEYAIADGLISTSTLQRRLKIGYARAGRLTDEMEESAGSWRPKRQGASRGSAADYAEEWEAMKANSE